MTNIFSAKSPTLASRQVLLTTAEVARSIRRSRERVLLAVREGELVPAFQLRTKGASNGAYLFTLDSVIAWRSPGERLPGL